MPCSNTALAGPAKMLTRFNLKEFLHIQNFTVLKVVVGAPKAKRRSQSTRARTRGRVTKTRWGKLVLLDLDLDLNQQEFILKIQTAFEVHQMGYQYYAPKRGYGLGMFPYRSLHWNEGRD